MKISIFSAFYPFRGGIAQFNARLFRELEKDHEVTAFTFKKQYPNFLFPGSSQFVQEEDKADRIPAKRIISTFNPFTYFSGSKSIRNSKPEIFVTNYWMSFFGVFMGFIAARLNSNTAKIAIIHNLIPHEQRFFDKWLNAYFLKKYDGFIVMSDAVKKDLLTVNPSAKFMHLNHPWYDHFGEKISQSKAREDLGVSNSKKTLLFFGLIRDYKGLDLLINAFGELDETYQLIIAGEVYSNLELYEKQIANSKNRERIYFFNQYIPDSEVGRYFSASDVCVLPYRSATQSGITATSFYYDVPIIATNVGGFQQIIGEPELGLIAGEPTSQVLKTGIESYFNDNLSINFKVNIMREKEKNSWSQFAKSLVLFGENIKERSL